MCLVVPSDAVHRISPIFVCRSEYCDFRLEVAVDMDGSLFLISRADIFSIYPKIFSELLATDDADRQVTPGGRLLKDFFNVPSDYDWKLKVYFRLLEMQRKLNEAEERGE